MEIFHISHPTFFVKILSNNVLNVRPISFFGHIIFLNFKCSIKRNLHIFRNKLSKTVLSFFFLIHSSFKIINYHTGTQTSKPLSLCCMFLTVNVLSLEIEELF